MATAVTPWPVRVPDAVEAAGRHPDRGEARPAEAVEQVGMALPRPASQNTSTSGARRVEGLGQQPRPLDHVAARRAPGPAVAQPAAATAARRGLRAQRRARTPAARTLRLPAGGVRRRPPRLARHPDQGGEGLGITHGQVGQGLAVDVDAGSP